MKYMTLKLDDALHHQMKIDKTQKNYEDWESYIEHLFFKAVGRKKE